MSVTIDQENSLTNTGSQRRLFMGGVGLGLASLALVTGGSAAFAEEKPALTDADILNFALNLEYLEAEFYQRAAFGRGLLLQNVQGQGHFGPVSGGRQVPFTSPIVRQYAMEIAEDENNHVVFLRSQLGNAAVARPKLNLDTSFTAAARAAGLISAGQVFDPYANETNFLLAAFIFEDVGVTAYKGAARFISNPDVLEAAAGILATEAYHSGIIRSALYQLGLLDQAKAISDLRDAVDGPDGIDQDLGTLERANLIPTDLNGLAYSRTPQQVLDIVYLGGQANGFGFFPGRTNGTIS
ncbi:hypothetical protein SAE02_65210 [Skermanella aerolata]|jgi:hypothetical protein|uniref:Ferritin-like domain-containing protein n=1 Tax=Skermanella aerolata TaxID=393310 RepID=A0A512E0W7_9PROT|nr:ferritin-like domain-containing protein [Skermanella aerolata]KJB91593.1 hypothetical protein N826_27200 [Skermanella aerolata KACC 11604]GEO42373.1 hypothetical protein SAE02_65210 [Skermanella aerolata]